MFMWGILLYSCGVLCSCEVLCSCGGACVHVEDLVVFICRVLCSFHAEYIVVFLLKVLQCTCGQSCF